MALHWDTRTHCAVCFEVTDNADREYYVCAHWVCKECYSRAMTVTGPRHSVHHGSCPQCRHPSRRNHFVIPSEQGGVRFMSAPRRVPMPQAVARGSNETRSCPSPLSCLPVMLWLRHYSLRLLLHPRMTTPATFLQLLRHPLLMATAVSFLLTLRPSLLMATAVIFLLLLLQFLRRLRGFWLSLWIRLLTPQWCWPSQRPSAGAGPPRRRSRNGRANSADSSPPPPPGSPTR